MNIRFLNICRKEHQLLKRVKWLKKSQRVDIIKMIRMIWKIKMMKTIVVRLYRNILNLKKNLVNIMILVKIQAMQICKNIKTAMKI